jgi:pilus assembly protein Flp/PilA
MLIKLSKEILSPQSDAAASYKEGSARMKSLMKDFLVDECGATAIEYALIAAFISIVIVTALTTLGTQLNAAFTAVSNGLGSN